MSHFRWLPTLGMFGDKLDVNVKRENSFDGSTLDELVMLRDELVKRKAIETTGTILLESCDEGIKGS